MAARQPLIVTIDGPAGSGKSTVARKLAARLGIAYLDTGAMYRALAWAALQGGVDFENDDALLEVARKTELALDCGPTHVRVRVDGRDVSEAVRSLAVAQVTPYIARHQGIRRLLVERQREIGRQLGALVTEGRDQGAVVFPDATVKFVLDASLPVRAARRQRDLEVDGESVEAQEILDNLTRRDELDSKQWAPLLEPGAAEVVDTTDLSLTEVVDRLVAIVERLSAEATQP
jgi:cytidylate kinase